TRREASASSSGDNAASGTKCAISSSLQRTTLAAIVSSSSSLIHGAGEKERKPMPVPRQASRIRPGAALTSVDPMSDLADTLSGLMVPPRISGNVRRERSLPPPVPSTQLALRALGRFSAVSATPECSQRNFQFGPRFPHNRRAKLLPSQRPALLCG